MDGPIKLQQSSYHGWTLSKEKIKQLKLIKKICAINNIKLIVFTAPLSQEHYEIAKASSGHDSYLESLKNIFGSVLNFHHDSIKNYSSNNEFHNSTHMTHGFSEILLRRMLTGDPKNLGERLLK